MTKPKAARIGDALTDAELRGWIKWTGRRPSVFECTKAMSDLLACRRALRSVRRMAAFDCAGYAKEIVASCNKRLGGKAPVR